MSLLSLVSPLNQFNPASKNLPQNSKKITGGPDVTPDAATQEEMAEEKEEEPQEVNINLYAIVDGIHPCGKKVKHMAQEHARKQLISV